MVNPIVKLTHEVASLRGRMAERLSNFEAVVDTVDPLVVTLPDGSQMEGLTPIGVQPRPGLSATVQVGEGRAWLLPHVLDGDPAPGELSPEVGAQISGLELGTERLADELLDVTAAARDFEQAYSLDRAETAVELGGIRDQVANVVLTALTTTRLAVISQDAGLYIDPTFSDASISAERATNTGMTYTPGGGLSGTSVTVFLTGQGKDEGVTIPLIPQDRYTARVWGTGLTAANGRVLAIKHSNGVVKNLPTVYGTGYMAATAVPTSAGARLLVRRISGTGSATITRVEVRHGLGGTLIDDNSIDADKINVDKAVIGLKLTSPDIETNPAASRGMKMIGDRFTGYSPTGQLQIDIGGPEGIIKGVTLEGVDVIGGSFKTNAGTNGYVDMRSTGTTHTVKAVGASGQTAFSLTGGTEAAEEYGLLNLFTGGGGRELYATAYMIQFQNNIGTYRGTLEIQNNDGGPVILSHKEPLSISSAHGVRINGYWVAEREEVALSSNATLIRQGRSRQVLVTALASLPEGNTSIFGTVPYEDRPDRNVFGTAYMSGYLGGAFVGAAGVVWITNRSGATRTAVQATINWTI